MKYYCAVNSMDIVRICPCDSLNAPYGNVLFKTKIEALDYFIESEKKKINEYCNFLEFSRKVLVQAYELKTEEV